MLIDKSWENIHELEDRSGTKFSELKTLPFDYLSPAKSLSNANRDSEIPSNLIDRLVGYFKGKRQRLKPCIHYLLRLSNGNLTW